MRLFLLRHGETEWSREGRHTGLVDLPLTANGERQARTLRAPLASRSFDRVLVSTLTRARQTCERAGLIERAEPREDLVEWDYGDYEGKTNAEIEQLRPGWTLWEDGCPGGEDLTAVAARVDSQLAELLEAEIDGDVALFSHRHTLRVLAARWLGLDAAAGKLLKLDSGTISALGHEHGCRVVLVWNAPADGGIP